VPKLKHTMRVYWLSTATTSLAALRTMPWESGELPAAEVKALACRTCDAFQHHRPSLHVTQHSSRRVNMVL
jgi:hypothetical protein